MKKINLICILFLFLNRSEATSSLIPDDMHSWGMASIDFVFRNNFRQAEEEARRILRRYPEHPAGYFFMAAVVDSWMAHFQCNSREKEFYQFCDLAIEKADEILRNSPSDQGARFFKGGAEGLKGTFEARYERWMTAFRYGWRGVSELMVLEKEGSELVDLQYGIGSYDYWRSAMTRFLWWMPGVQDKRELGIEKLNRVSKNGLYTRISASVVLIDIYLNENRYSDALSTANSMLALYPDARSFLFGRGNALLGLKQYAEAAVVFEHILATVQKESPNNGYNEILCRLALSQIKFELGDFSEAVSQCDTILNKNLSNPLRRRLEEVLSEANALRRKANR